MNSTSRKPLRTAVKLIGAALALTIAAGTVGSTAARADDGFRGNGGWHDGWHDRGDWREQAWRHREWQERAWREHEWRERHPYYGYPQVVYPYGPPAYYYRSVQPGFNVWLGGN